MIQEADVEFQEADVLFQEANLGVYGIVTQIFS